jgi:hypothetical protein
MGLLGFPGDILILDGNTMRVRDGFDLLTLAEREQINRIAPLGWYFLKLSAFVDKYEMKWGGRARGKVFQAYRTAMSLGVSDLLSEYASDVAFLEQLVLAEGPVPLSQILLHMQKYIMTLPAIYAVCDEMERRNVHGCQVLDFLTRYQSGVPVVLRTVQHMIHRVRSVFLKQCLAWMIYGELSDPGNEFFIHSRAAPAPASTSTSGQHRGVQEEARMRLGRASLRAETDASSFLFLLFLCLCKPICARRPAFRLDHDVCASPRPFARIARLPPHGIEGAIRRQGCQAPAQLLGVGLLL